MAELKKIEREAEKALEDFGVGKEVRGWSPALIENKLKALGD